MRLELLCRFYWKQLYILGWLVILLYTSYMVYQFQTYSWWVVKWHTHLALPFTLFMFAIGSSYIICNILSLNHKPFIKHSFYTLWLLWTVEFILIASGIGVKMGDAPWGRFVDSNKVKVNANYYQIWSPNIQINIEKEEFTHSRTTNSLGFADGEWSVEKKENVFRVLCIGDSFTEGDGADFNESYVAQLRQLFPEMDSKVVEILNAGSCGSDPFYNYINYQDRLHVYLPDLIIQTISSHDIFSDISGRGGLERFDEDKKRLNSTFKLWKIFYTSNYIVRIVVTVSEKINKLFRYNILSLPFPIDKALAELFAKYDALASTNHAKLVVVFLPIEVEVCDGRYVHPMQTIQRNLKKEEIMYIDLLPCYRNRTDNGTKANAYYWKIDSHHNPKGYRMMAECIYEGLRKESLLKHQN